MPPLTRLIPLTLALALAGASDPAWAQSIGTRGSLGAVPSGDPLSDDDLILRTRTPRPPAVDPRTGALIEDALEDPPIVEEAPPAAPPLAPPGAEAEAIDPRDLGLRGRVAPLRSVVRPVLPAAPALPVTGPAPEPFDPEAVARADYDPTGLRMGSFDVFTTAVAGVSTRFGTTDETALRGSAEVVARSNFERHGLDLTLRGGVRRTEGDELRIAPETDVIVDGRLELTEVDRIAATASWRLRREDSSSAEIGAGTGKDIDTLSAEIGYARTAGLIGLDLRAAADRSIYEAGSDRDNTALSGTARLTLRSGAVLQPFVEAGVFHRIYESEVDSAGYRRTSLGGELKGGLAFDTGLLSGEIAAGYAVERPEDDRLVDIRAFVADGALAWTVSPIASFALRGVTAFEPTEIAGASGSVTRTLSLDGSYYLRPNLLLTAGADYSLQDYAGIAREVRTTTVRAGAAYRLNRNVEFGLTASHQVKDSSAAGEDERNTTVEATVTLRR